MKSLQELCAAFYAQSGPIFVSRVALKPFLKMQKVYGDDERDSIQSQRVSFSHKPQPLFSSSSVQGLSYKV